jgi:spermidine synthase
VDVLEPTPEFMKGQRFKMLVHDGMWGSIMRAEGTDPASLAFYERDARVLPFTVLPPEPRVVVIGAAGGAEVRASLRKNAAHVTAVELNPVTVSLLTDHFAEFSGRLAEDPRVTLVCAEGRTWLMRSDDPVDLIWFVAPDSYAAMNAATSGAYVLSESYLYTVEMIVESLQRLTPAGIVAIQFGEIDFERKPNRTLRYLVTAREALRRLGIGDPARHLLVSTTSGFGFTSSTILVKREPFTDAEAARFAEVSRGLDGGQVRWTPREATPGPARPSCADDAASPPGWLPGRTTSRSSRTMRRSLALVSFRQALRTSPGGRVAMEHGLGEHSSWRPRPRDSPRHAAPRGAAGGAGHWRHMRSSPPASISRRSDSGSCSSRSR